MEKPVLGLDHLGQDMKVTTSRVISYRTHSHMYNEMLFYDPFDGFVTVDREIIRADDGLLLLVAPTNFHSTTLEAESTARYTKIAFRDDFPGSAFGAGLTQSMLLKSFAKNAFLVELRKRCETADSDHSLAILINAILLELTEKGEKLGSPDRKINDLPLAAARLINERFNESITLKSVADELHVTPQYLSAIFSESVGVTFSSYLRDKRLSYAAGLLAGSERSVTEICYLCGFANLSHFIRSFEREYGRSPAVWRRDNMLSKHN